MEDKLNQLSSMKQVQLAHSSWDPGGPATKKIIADVVAKINNGPVQGLFRAYNDTLKEIGTHPKVKAHDGQAAQRLYNALQEELYNLGVFWFAMVTFGPESTPASDFLSHSARFVASPCWCT